MSEIRTYADLLAEKKRLEVSLAVQREAILQDFTALREEWRPALHLLSVAGKFTRTRAGNAVLAIGAGLAGEALLRNTLLSRSCKVVRFVLPMVAKGVTAWAIAIKGKSFLQRVSGILRNLRFGAVSGNSGNSLKERRLRN